MSLLKQLLLSVTVAVMVIVAGTLAFSISSARSYLDAQVRTASENAATALAITLSQPSNQDPIVRELLLMGLYDTGSFRAVTLTDTEGNVLFERRRSPSADAGSAPQWFRSLLPLEPVMATRVVSDGWKQVGTLGIVGNNSYAYESLWRNALGQVTLVLAAGLLWALVAILSVRWLRRVLNEQVANQVRAIAQDGEAPPMSKGLRELNALVGEIAQVRQRVRANVDEMDAQIESLTLELNQDPVTGLGNRKYFLNQLGRSLKQEYGSGHVLMMRIRDLGAVNAANTRREVDDWLRGVAHTALSWAQETDPEIQVARLNGSDFAVLMPNGNSPKDIGLTQELAGRLRDMRLGLAEGQPRWAFSLTDYTEGDSVSTVMGLLDYGLMRAESAGHAQVEYVPKQDGLLAHAGPGEGAWRELLGQALEHDDLHLHVNDVSYQAPDGALLHRSDAFLQLRDGSEWLAGTIFMPVAVRLGMSADFDLRAIELAVDWIRANSRDLVLRVSLASLGQTEFWPSLEQKFKELAESPQLATHLVFEIDAYGLVANPEQAAQFCAAARKISAKVGIRRLDAEPAALGRLHQVQADYLRLTGPLLDIYPAEAGKIELLRAVAATAAQLGMNTYSDAPATDEAQKLLRECQFWVASR